MVSILPFDTPVIDNGENVDQLQLSVNNGNTKCNDTVPGMSEIPTRVYSKIQSIDENCGVNNKSPETTGTGTNLLKNPNKQNTSITHQCLNIKPDNTKDQCLTLTDEEVTEDEDTDTGSETEDHETVSPGLKLFSHAKCNSPTPVFLFANKNYNKNLRQVKTASATTSSKLTSATTSSNLTNATTSSKLTNATTSSKLTNATTSSKLTSATTSSKLTNATTSSKLTNATISSKLTSATTSSKLTNATTSSKLTNATTSSKLTNATTSSKLTNATTSSKLTSATTSSKLTNATTSSKLTSVMKYAQKVSNGNTVVFPKVVAPMTCVYISKPNEPNVVIVRPSTTRSTASGEHEPQVKGTTIFHSTASSLLKSVIDQSKLHHLKSNAVSAVTQSDKHHKVVTTGMTVIAMSCTTSTAVATNVNWSVPTETTTTTKVSCAPSIRYSNLVNQKSKMISNDSFGNSKPFQIKRSNLQNLATTSSMPPSITQSKVTSTSSLEVKSPPILISIPWKTTFASDKSHNTFSLSRPSKTGEIIVTQVTTNIANSTKSIASICQSQGGNTTETSVNGLYRKQLTPGKSVSVQNMTVKVIRSSNTPVTTQSILRSALIQKIINSTQQAQRPPILQTGSRPIMTQSLLPETQTSSKMTPVLSQIRTMTTPIRSITSNTSAPNTRSFDTKLSIQSSLSTTTTLTSSTYNTVNLVPQLVYNPDEPMTYVFEQAPNLSGNTPVNVFPTGLRLPSTTVSSQSSNNQSVQQTVKIRQPPNNKTANSNPICKVSNTIQSTQSLGKLCSVLPTTPSGSLQNNISLLQDAVKKDYIYSKTTPQIKVSVGGCGRGKLLNETNSKSMANSVPSKTGRPIFLVSPTETAILSKLSERNTECIPPYLRNITPQNSTRSSVVSTYVGRDINKITPVNSTVIHSPGVVQTMTGKLPHNVLAKMPISETNNVQRQLIPSNNSSLVDKDNNLKKTMSAPVKTYTVRNALKTVHMVNNTNSRQDEHNSETQQLFIIVDQQPVDKNDTTAAHTLDQAKVVKGSYLCPRYTKPNVPISRPFNCPTMTRPYSYPTVTRTYNYPTMTRPLAPPVATALTSLLSANVIQKNNPVVCEKHSVPKTTIICSTTEPDVPCFVIDSVFSLRQDTTTINKSKYDDDQSDERIHFSNRFDNEVRRSGVKLDDKTKSDAGLRRPCFVVLENIKETVSQSKCTIKCRKNVVQNLCKRIMEKFAKRKRSRRKRMYTSKQRARKKTSSSSDTTSGGNTVSSSLVQHGNADAVNTPNANNALNSANKTITDEKGNTFLMLKLENKTILIPTLNKIGQPTAYVLENESGVSLTEAVQKITKQHMASHMDRTTTSVLSVSKTSTPNIVTKSSDSSSLLPTSVPMTTSFSRVKDEPTTRGYGDEAQKDYSITVKSEPISSDCEPTPSKMARIDVTPATETASDRIKRLKNELKSQEQALDEIRRKRAKESKDLT